MICWYFPIHYYNYNIGSADWTVNVVCVTSETMSQVFWDLAMPGHVRWQLSTLFKSRNVLPSELQVEVATAIDCCIEVTLARGKALRKALCMHFVSFCVIAQIIMCSCYAKYYTSYSRVMLMLQQKGLHQY